MGMVVMSKRELNRTDALARSMAVGRSDAAHPAADPSIVKRCRDGGASAIANPRRGRPSNNRLSVSCVITPSRWSGVLRRPW